MARGEGGWNVVLPTPGQCLGRGMAVLLVSFLPCCLPRCVGRLPRWARRRVRALGMEWYVRGDLRMLMLKGTEVAEAKAICVGRC